MAVITLALYPPDPCADCLRVGLQDGWLCWETHPAGSFHRDSASRPEYYITVDGSSLLPMMLDLDGTVAFAGGAVEDHALVV